MSTNSATIVDDDFRALTNFETLEMADGSNSVTLGSKSVTTGITKVVGGGGSDTIVAHAASQSFEGGEGNDTFEFTTALLAGNSASTATYDGGAGTGDKVKISNAGTTVDDDDFRGMSNIEVLVLANGGNTIVLGDIATAAGILTVTGGTGDDIITAGAGNHTINGGDGADLISGGAGVDIINGGSGADVITLGDSTDGNNYDQITGFATTSDDIKALQSVHGWNSTDGTSTVLLATGATLKAADVAGDSNIMTISSNVSTHTYITFMAGTSTYDQLETAAATAMGATGALDAAAVVLVAVDDGTHTGLWQFTSGDAAVDDATETSEIELIGILKGVADASALVVGDFVFA